MDINPQANVTVKGSVNTIVTAPVVKVDAKTKEANMINVKTTGATHVKVSEQHQMPNMNVNMNGPNGVFNTGMNQVNMTLLPTHINVPMATDASYNENHNLVQNVNANSSYAPMPAVKTNNNSSFNVNMNNMPSMPKINNNIAISVKSAAYQFKCVHCQNEGMTRMTKSVSG